MTSLEQMKAEVTRCVVEAWREQRSVTGAVNEIMDLIETAINARTQEVVEIIENYRKTADEHPEPSEVEWVCSDLITALSPEVKDDSK